MIFDFALADQQVRKLVKMGVIPTVIFINPKTHWDLGMNNQDYATNQILNGKKLFNLDVKLSKDVQPGKFYLSFENL